MLQIKPQDVAALIEAFERSASQEMRVAANGFELHLSKSANGLRSAWGKGHGAASATVVPDVAVVAPVARAAPATPEAVPQDVRAAAPAKPVAAEPPAGHAYVRAANLGTFYRAPKPGAENYVEIGSRVTEETEVCLIEVMKLFTPLIAGIAGTVREVLVNDSMLVEFDQPLFLVELDA